ncbi:MAG: response regulator transcription factor [Lachnospiraceae bacterium]|nr:response regulator transcription factor [Lachnospiraceae bacterium]
MKKIVIVEDDIFMQEELMHIFQKEGYAVSCITRFSQTVTDILDADASLVLLDLNLPGMNGFEICRQIKRQYAVPILILTSRDQLKDELHALSLGADDYLTKPCNTKRLLARVENLLKRFAGREGMLDGDGFLLDYRTYTLYAEGESILLSEREGKILECLLLQKGEVVTKEALFEALWGTSEYVDENALQVNMTRLRRTLKKVGLSERVETVRGEGYRLRLKE